MWTFARRFKRAGTWIQLRRSKQSIGNGCMFRTTAAGYARYLSTWPRLALFSFGASIGASCHGFPAYPMMLILFFLQDDTGHLYFRIHQFGDACGDSCILLDPSAHWIFARSQRLDWGVDLDIFFFFFRVFLWSHLHCTAFFRVSRFSFLTLFFTTTLLHRWQNLKHILPSLWQPAPFLTRFAVSLCSLALFDWHFFASVFSVSSVQHVFGKRGCQRGHQRDQGHSRQPDCHCSDFGWLCADQLAHVCVHCHDYR